MFLLVKGLYDFIFRDPILDQYLLNFLIEDEIMGSESYPDFLCKIHSEIQKKLS